MQGILLQTDIHTYDAVNALRLKRRCFFFSLQCYLSIVLLCEVCKYIVVKKTGLCLFCCECYNNAHIFSQEKRKPYSLTHFKRQVKSIRVTVNNTAHNPCGIWIEFWVP